MGNKLPRGDRSVSAPHGSPGASCSHGDLASTIARRGLPRRLGEYLWEQWQKAK
jgi:hypothetical protein